MEPRTLERTADELNGLARDNRTEADRLNRLADDQDIQADANRTEALRLQAEMDDASRREADAQAELRRT